MLFVFEVLTIVASSVRPCVYPATVKLVFSPAAFKTPSIRPLVNSKAFYLVVTPLTLVICTVSPCVLTKSVLFTVSELSSIFRPVFQYFYSITMLQIVNPISIVGLTTLVPVKSLSVSFIIFEITLKNVTVNMEKLTMAKSLPQSPISHITSAILPGLSAEAVL